MILIVIVEVDWYSLKFVKVRDVKLISIVILLYKMVFFVDLNVFFVVKNVFFCLFNFFLNFVNNKML